MRPIVDAVVSSGIIDPEDLKQFRRWGVELPDANDAPISGAYALERIQAALESSDQIHVGQTDFAVLEAYRDVAKRVHGRLCLRDAGKRRFVNVAFVWASGKHSVAVPWLGDDMPDELLTNGDTYLRYTDDGGAKVDLYFDDVMPLRYGNDVLFILCRVAVVENGGDD
jgi:glycosyltransferase involved in cell wall biosynthesis